MGFQDSISYVLFKNPIASGTTAYIWDTASSVHNYIRPKPKLEVRMAPSVPLWKLIGGSCLYVKLAALSGAAAVALGAYGSHREFPQAEDKQRSQKQIFETANRYHFIHTLAMLGVPFCRASFLAGTFLFSGMILFCGTCYYHAFTGDTRYRKATPVGGVCFILGWLCMCI